MSDSAYLDNVRLACVGELEGYVGRLWKDVKSEWHAAFDEMPIWILLYEDSDLQNCHAAVCEVLEPKMGCIAPNNFTLTYIVNLRNMKVSVDSFMDNSEILEAKGRATLGEYPDFSERKGQDVFGNVLSGKTPV